MPSSKWPTYRGLFQKRPHGIGKPAKTRGRDWSTEVVLDQTDGWSFLLDWEKTAIVQDDPNIKRFTKVSAAVPMQSTGTVSSMRKRGRPPPKVHWTTSLGRGRNMSYQLMKTSQHHYHQVLLRCYHLCKVRIVIVHVFVLVWTCKQNGFANLLLESNLFISMVSIILLYVVVLYSSLCNYIWPSTVQQSKKNKKKPNYIDIHCIVLPCIKVFRNWVVGWVV